MSTLPSDEITVIPVDPALLHPKPPGRAPNCDACGRFCFWNYGEGHWQCRLLSYDSYNGGWEHM